MASNFKSPYTANVQGQDKIFSPCCPDCSTIDFQLPQGIEFGYKNRFNNVWPYEHSRVRLGQAKKETLSVKHTTEGEQLRTKSKQRRKMIPKSTTVVSTTIIITQAVTTNRMTILMEIISTLVL